MPMLDMPLEELRRYEGRNPRPADFDAYWERALAEMKAIDPQVELVPAAFQVPHAECFDLYFTGVKGARIHAKYVRPKNIPQPHPALLHFHGYSGHSGDWMDKLGYAALGFSFFSLDVRGQGGSSEDVGGVKGNTLQGHIIRGLDGEPDDLLFRHIFLDTAQLAGIAMGMPEVDPERVGATGWSQGGALTIACAALEPRIKRAAPVYPFLSDYQRVWEMDQAKDAYEELRGYFRRFDPRHRREEEIFTRLGYIDIQHLASRITAEVLLGVGLMDSICPPSTQFAAYNKIASPKSLEIYPDYGHEGLPGLHDDIVQFMLKL
ncbi:MULTISPECIES: alpha/beta fold hydrolase [unclassified Paenibacillus]|uniref:acetylxylan esterase n=1 Tax=unclassified Paenibacillus TaxID=185978 RepID=UPI00095514F1|nr:MULTISPECIES: alpha/beta fold hydrolase [unclassified Paenibacillus]ASS68552.1 acetylxylan esterase [Paenibacillus sp. RUD330]SIR63215.1 cephalosporin-C deacetylase [Paenibacillus sp. RU4X]SIR71694.1 cephalosporin-C deacetylase [Paenibacillus sp. RU4T]